MKSFEMFLFEGVVYIDTERKWNIPSWVASTARSVMKGKVAGKFEVAGTKTPVDMYLIEMNERDYKWTLAGAKLKEDEEIYRYVSPDSYAGGLTPVIKVNKRTGNVAFLINEKQERNLRFDKWTKTVWLRLLEVPE